MDCVAVWCAKNEVRPWECLQSRKDEEAVPLLEVRALRAVAAIYRSTTGVDVDVFPSEGADGSFR